ncbi:hypothetical protein [Marinifilum caeruleilacunae]|uniref:Uncharacterized protein n=1 Tax=Marinifilum caeruleilacunae TaxID=2499076 RepID=A0ABX1WR66_9BACT|nr:hypothetical protein [Marinifilum caeruleilacunae]NOU58501.1 hypothetical protein [Marinifilum caeruleilacunae]
MKNLILLTILISLFSCKMDKEDYIIKKFENLLGEQETKFLNELVTDLDLFLDSEYPGKKLKFKEYLKDISKSSVKTDWTIDDVKLQSYKESNLFGKYDTIYPDSVWHEGISFKINHPNHGISEELIPIDGQNKQILIDSILNLLKNKPLSVLTEASCFYSALDSVKQSDALIIEYLDAKQAVGRISQQNLADGLLSNYDDSKEYFAKRIYIINRYDL